MSAIPVSPSVVFYGVACAPALSSPMQTAFTSTQRRWSDIEEAISLMQRLRDNWDYEGAVAPDPEVVSGALALVRHERVRSELPPPFAAVASPNGDIVIEWRPRGGVYLEVTMGSPDEAEWMLKVSPDAPARHWTTNWHVDRNRQFQDAACYNHAY